MVFAALLHDLFSLRPVSEQSSCSSSSNSDVMVPPIPPLDFLITVAKSNPFLASGEMHDAQELLAWLLGTLHEDLNRARRRPADRELRKVNASNTTLEPERFAAEAWQEHLKQNRSIVVDLFQGQLRSRLHCPICGTRSITFDPFLYLSLPLPTAVRTVALAELVSVFCQEEALDLENGERPDTAAISHNFFVSRQGLWWCT